MTDPIVERNVAESWLRMSHGNIALWVLRIPMDHEWSCAVGIADREKSDETPEEKSGRIDGVYSWGTDWPPPTRAGNYADEALKHPPAIKGYDDGFAFTSPIRSFSPNRFGLFDVGGNVWQLCQDWYNSSSEKTPRALLLRFDGRRGVGARLIRQGAEEGHDKIDLFRFKFATELEPAHFPDGVYQRMAPG